MGPKQVLTFLWLVLFLLEPFLFLAPPSQHAKPTLCATCGMKDRCGSVCCCAHPQDEAGADCADHAAGLYAAGCQPDRSAAQFLGQSLVKWVPPAQTFRRPSLGLPLDLPGSSFPESPFDDIPSPPPKLQSLS